MVLASEPPAGFGEHVMTAKIVDLFSQSGAMMMYVAARRPHMTTTDDQSW